MTHNQSHGRWRPINGFRVKSSRSSAHRLRIRFLDIIKLPSKLKSTCDHILELLKKGIRGGSNGSGSRRRVLVTEGPRFNGHDHKLHSCRRSNSFYAEAIADCLEFIKRSAVTVDDVEIDGRRVFTKKGSRFESCVDTCGFIRQANYSNPIRFCIQTHASLNDLHQVQKSILVLPEGEVTRINAKIATLKQSNPKEEGKTVFQSSDTI